MSRSLFETQFLINEAESLLARLKMIKPFTMNMPMVMAASVSDKAMQGITNLIVVGYKELKKRINDYINGLKSSLTTGESPQEIQAKFSILKLRFNALLDQIDIFGDVLSQRAEHETGIWASGLDVLAEDALKLEGQYFDAPPLVCFLERGHGAAIRRARTRLPGGELNPVAVIQVPRERMVGSGIASSLIHEVGHQGSALLGLVDSIRKQIRRMQRSSPYKASWECYHRWISEILSDFWAMAFLGIGSTIGLMSVVSLPKYFVYRMTLAGPHPFPWIRVKLSLAFGKALYPHPQWARYEALWERMYPSSEASQSTRALMEELELTMSDFVKLVIRHRPISLKGCRLVDVFPYSKRQPAQLQHLYNLWRLAPDEISKARPTLVFAVIGQARADVTISALKESELLSKWLSNWAMLNSENRMKRELPEIYKELKQLVNN
jgi:hypothetical protein